MQVTKAEHKQQNEVSVPRKTTSLGLKQPGADYEVMGCYLGAGGEQDVNGWASALLGSRNSK